MSEFGIPDTSGAGVHFIVASEVMTTFMIMVKRVARHTGTVLISGETGSGKELIAHAIHERSLRCAKPFVEINCAALPENLVESELFGYEKGAFSGADTAKPGLFEVAHLGTIFLDEIGELDLKIQVKLLRVLDRAPYYRLGGHQKITSDVRIVAATNRDLRKEVSAGRFRKDLYHRLSQFELNVPPLRERVEDISALARHFLIRQGAGLNFSDGALRALESYAWPGNVRELQNVVTKVAVLAFGPDISASEVKQELRNTMYRDEEPLQSTALTTNLDGLQEFAIKKALEDSGGHRGRAAQQLGISRRTLSRKLREYGLTAGVGAPSRALGSLRGEQQRCFRIPVRIAVSLQDEAGATSTCIAVNFSEGGMGVEELRKDFGHNTDLQVRLQLPFSAEGVKIMGRLVWVNAQGRAGITFTNVTPATRRELNRWLRREMQDEGWRMPTDETMDTNPQSASINNKEHFLK